MKFLQLYILMLLSSVGSAQLDTEHFIPPVYPSTHAWVYPREQVVYISTPTVTPFSYTIKDGAGNILKSGVVSNATPISYQMSAYVSDFVVTDADLNKVLTDRGLHIEADEKVYCNLRAQAGGGTRPNATSMTAKGRAALGTAFRIGHFPSPSAHVNKSSTVGIYATEDGTNVSIDLTTRQPVLRGAGAPSTANIINITLNKGETYVIAIKGADSPLNRNLGMIGGLITSDKGIVVNCGSWGGNFTNTDVMDIGMDQIVGADKIGKEYVVVRGALTRNNPAHERVLIVAHQANTEVKVNGVIVATIANAGGTYYVPSTKYAANGTMFIETSVPAYAYQFMMGANDYNYKTQGMNFLPPISCKTTSFVDNIPFIEKISTKNYGGAISVVTTSGATLTVTANGVNKAIGAPKAVPGSNYVAYKITGLTGNVAVYSNTIALVSIVGQNAAAGYGGFFSGFVDSEISQAVSCLPGYLFEPNELKGTFRWFKDGVEIAGETNDSLFATETGDYTFERTLAGCKDTSANIPAVGVNQFSFEGDTAFCPGDSVLVSIIGSGYDSLSWETGAQTASVYINTYGSTAVRIYSDVAKECFVDTSVITTATICPVNLILKDTITICKGDTALMQAIDLSTLTWSGGSLLSINDSAVSVYPIITTTYTVQRFLSRGDLLTNSDFENVNLPGTNAQLDASLVTGWNTTATDNKIEIWRNGFLGHPSYSGQFFAELNATQPSALYQDITTTPGETIHWGFAHRGRSTNETMQFKIGPAGGAYVKIGDYTDSPTAWGYYSGEYIVPVGQTLTRFLFSATDGDAAANLIDAATFEALLEQTDSVIVVVNELPVVSIADSTICSGDSVQFDAQNLGSSFLWSTAESSQTVSVKAAGEYYVEITDVNGCKYIDTMNLSVVSCNTDAAVTKTDGRDDYTPGTTTTYTIVAKNLGPTDFSNGTITDPLPSGISSGDVSWGATAFGGASTSVIGSQQGLLNDIVSIPVGDSVVYSVNIAVPPAYKGDLINTVTISVSIDTNAVNDIATDTDYNGLCLGATTSSFEEQFNTGVKINPGENDPNWTIQWINDPAYHVYSANSYANPNSNAVIPAVGMNKAAGVWGDASYPDYLWVCYPWTGANNGPGKHIDVDGDGFIQEYSGGQPINGTGDAVILRFSKTFEMTAAQVAASELSFSVAADNNIMDIVVNGVSQGPKALGSYQLIPHTITQNFKVGTNTIEIVVNSGPGYAGMMIANSTIKAVDSVSLVITDPPFPCAPARVDITDSLWTVGSINMGANTYFTDAVATVPHNSPMTANVGTYYVVTTTPLGCSDTAAINVGEHPNPDVTLRSDTSFCEGGSVNIDAGQGSNLILSWSVGGATQSITADTSGSYKLVVTDVNSCSDSDSVMVAILPLPLVNIGVDSIICPEDSVELDAGNIGSSFIWSTTEVSQTILVSTAGLYFVELTDVNGCRGNDTMELLLHTAPVLDLGPDRGFCTPNSTSIDAGQWNSIAWSTGSIIDSITISTSSQIYLDVTDANGCATNDSINVTVHALPVVTLRNDTNICRGDQIAVGTTNSGLFHLWSTGAISETITIDTADTYTVFVTDNNGCVGVQSMTLEINENPTSNLPDQTYCAPDSALIVAAPWNKYLWSTGATGNQITVTSSEVITLIVKDLKECSGYDTVEIVINPLPMIDLGNDTTICINETLTLDPGGVNLTYLWNTGDAAQNINQSVIVAEGSYVVEATTQFNCKSSDTINISMDLIPDPYPIKPFDVCEGGQVELKPQDGYSMYTIDWLNFPGNSSAIDVTESGSYFSEVSTTFCADTFELTLEVIEIPLIEVVSISEKGLDGRLEFCFDLQEVGLHVLSTNADSITYVWSTNETTEVIEIFEQGVYTVVANNRYCESSAEIEIVEFCEAKFYVPNAFTPNGDGKNDLFPSINYNLTSYQLDIYDRWGLKLFSTDNPKEGWDGTYMGGKVQVDVYVYKISYSFLKSNGDERNDNVVGTVTLVR